MVVAPQLAGDVYLKGLVVGRRQQSSVSHKVIFLSPQLIHYCLHVGVSKAMS